MSDYLTVGEVADRWRGKSRVVLNRIKAGELKATFIGGRWLVRPDDLDTYERSRTNVQPTAKRTRRPRPRARSQS